MAGSRFNEQFDLFAAINLQMSNHFCSHFQEEQGSRGGDVLTRQYFLFSGWVKRKQQVLNGQVVPIKDHAATDLSFGRMHWVRIHFLDAPSRLESLCDEADGDVRSSLQWFLFNAFWEYARIGVDMCERASVIPQRIGGQAVAQSSHGQKFSDTEAFPRAVCGMDEKSRWMHSPSQELDHQFPVLRSEGLSSRLVQRQTCFTLIRPHVVFVQNTCACRLSTWCFLKEPDAPGVVEAWGSTAWPQGADS